MSNNDAEGTVLLSLYNEFNTDARWQEECRERSASAIIAANSIIVGIMATFELQFPFLLFCVVQYFLAQVGQQFVLKYHALSERRHAYVNALLNLIKSSSSQPIEKALEAVRANQRERLKEGSRLWRQLINADKNTNIHELWYHLHGTFKFISVLLAAIIVLVDLQKEKGVSFIYRILDGSLSLINAFPIS